MKNNLFPARVVRLASVLVVLTAFIWLFTFFHYGSESLHYALVMNVLLAATPFLLACLLRWRSARKGKVWVVLLVILWLFFLANAPYMLTDLVHLQEYNYNVSLDVQPDFAVWLAWAHILACVLAGCLFGFLSVYLVQLTVGQRFGRAAGWLCSGGVALACGFGIYIGRFMRFHSVDLFKKPGEVFGMFAERLEWASAQFVLLFAAVTFGAYFIFCLCFHSEKG